MPASYLIVGPSWVGDMVMAQSLFITLQQRDPGANIDVLGPEWSTPVLARMQQVGKSIPLALTHREWGFGVRRRLGRSLRNDHYDRAIVLPRSWKSALVPFFADIKSRTGFLGEQRYGLLTERRVLDKRILNQTVKRFVSLGLPLSEAYPPVSIPRPVLRVDAENQSRLYRRLGLPGGIQAAVLMPGSEYGPAKQWPLEHFRQVAAHLLARGNQVWVLGSRTDHADGDRIVDQLEGPVFNLCGQTGLADAIDLIAAANLAVCNDSGLMHIAAAVGTHVHALYGSTSAAYTPPLTESATLHSLDLPCSPCFQRVCRYGHYNCLRQLVPERVIEQLEHGKTEVRNYDD
jgi:heptosyltransferase-2